MKYIRIISLFLGISMLAFGSLKFVNPFKTWYAIQIAKGELGIIPYRMGVVGEIVVGLIFIAATLQMRKFSPNRLWLSIFLASSTVIIMMGTGIYVHLHPNVPAEVLPLKIKPPYIPGLFIALAFLNTLLTYKKFRAQKKVNKDLHRQTTAIT